MNLSNPLALISPSPIAHPERIRKFKMCLKKD